MWGLGLSFVACAAMLWLWLWLRQGMRRVPLLAQVPDTLPDPAPRVSVIFSALNEASTLEPALRSLLALDYPALEVVAVNDRSSDATGEILDRVAREDPRLRVIHIAELPAGWLGKNHALQRAGELATGDWLLFTDADVVFEASALRRAVAWSEQHALDHLVVLAEFVVREHLLASLLLNFWIAGYAECPPWRVRDKPGVYIGMGAFNLVRASAYRATGGHEPLRLEVVDDIMLGKQIKARGLRQDALLGLRSVMVEWYPDTAGLARGLEKNTLAMLNYRLGRLVAATGVVLLVRYWPWLGLWLTSGWAWWLNLGAILFGVLAHAEVMRATRWSWRCFAWWPLSPAIMMGILWRAAILTLRRGGVIWRGTRYSLDELRRARTG